MAEVAAIDRQEVTRVTPQRLPSAASSEAAALISMIERAAADPSIDIERVERMYVMYERAAARNAKAAYVSALAEMQPRLPIIEKRGEIKKNEKDERGQRTGAQVAMTKYAKWEDVVEGIRPIMAEHGFSISFRVSQPTADRITVTGVLGHRDGHTEETSMSLPIDSSGAKNNVQGWGSSVSYGKRYVAFALLNIVARGEDDDAQAASKTAKETISDDQVTFLKSLMEKASVEADIILQFFKVDALSELTPEQMKTAVAKLNKKIEQSS